MINKCVLAITKVNEPSSNGNRTFIFCFIHENKLRFEDTETQYIIKIYTCEFTQLLLAAESLQSCSWQLHSFVFIPNAPGLHWR